MGATVGAVLATHNLAVGVLVGVLFSAILFARKVAKTFVVDAALSADGQTRTYAVRGALFFVSVEAFGESLDFREPVARVVIDVSRANVWDASGVAALDRAVLKFRAGGVDVSLVGLSAQSAPLVERLATYHRPDAALPEAGHQV